MQRAAPLYGGFVDFGTFEETLMPNDGEMIVYRQT